MTKKQNNGHGGTREGSGGTRLGAGRPKFEDIGLTAKTKAITVRLTDEEKDRAESIGEGSVSAGIRLAINSYKLKK